MINNSILFYLAGFLFIAFLNGCTGEKDPPVVDQDYLKSDEYQNFEKKSRQEASRKENQDRSFLAQLQSIGNCEQNKTDLPLELNRKGIAGLVKGSTESCEQLAIAEDLGYKVQLLKEIQQRDYSLKLVLLNRKSVYVDWLLFAATFRNDRVVDFKKVGIFQKNLSKDIDTEIKVMEKGENLIINSRTNRRIIYPFNQKNTTKRQFTVNPKGIIQNSE